MKFFDLICQLYQQELYEDLVFCYTRSSEASTLKAKQDAITLVYLADSHYQLENFVDAARLFCNALQQYRHIKGGSGKLQPEVLSEAEISFRLHNCFLKTRKYEEAYVVLSKVPNVLMTPKIKLAMAKLVPLQPRVNATTLLDKLNDVYTMCPYAYGTAAELLRNGRSLQNLECDDAGLKQFLEAQSMSFTCPGSAARLLHSMPNTCHSPALLIELGLMYNRLGMRYEARAQLWRAFQLDNNTVTAMDTLASLLSRDELIKDLEVLAMHLFNRSDDKVQTFIALGYLAKNQGKCDRALHFAYKASLMGRQPSQESMLLKSQILADKDRSDDAAKHLLEILSDDPRCIDAYEALCQLHLQNDRRRDASNVVGQCVSVLGEIPRVKTLQAMIQLKDDPCSKEAEILLESVMECQPYLSDALFLLLDVYKECGHFDKAIDLLKKVIESAVPESASLGRLHHLLGDCYAKARRPGEAHSALNRAMALGEVEAQTKMNALNGQLQYAATTENTLPVTVTPIPAAPRRRRNNHSPSDAPNPASYRLTFS